MVVAVAVAVAVVAVAVVAVAVAVVVGVEKRVLDPCYDRGSRFGLRWFLNDGAP